MPVTRIVPASPITNAPHQFVPLVRPCSGSNPSTEVTAHPSWRSGQARRTRFLEERQVTLYLPVGHDGVPGVELLALDLRVVVDVIAAGRLAQRLAQRAVGAQFVRRVQQGRRQGPDSAAGDLLGPQGVRGGAGGLSPLVGA